MSRKLDDISYKFRSTVFEFLSRCLEAGIPLLIVDTLRTPQEQLENIAKGVSWTKESKHLAHDPDGKSLAIDVVPYVIFNAQGGSKLNWNAEDPIWEEIAKIGESLGMTAGYRWTKKDCGHFEYKQQVQPPPPTRKDDYVA